MFSNVSHDFLLRRGLNGSPLYVCVGGTMERAAFITMTESILKHIYKTNSMLVGKYQKVWDVLSRDGDGTIPTMCAT